MAAARYATYAQKINYADNTLNLMSVLQAPTATVRFRAIDDRPLLQS